MQKKLEKEGYKTKLCYSCGLITNRLTNIVLYYGKDVII